MKIETKGMYDDDNHVPYNFVTDVLARKTGVNEEILRGLAFEKINLLWALEGALNQQAMTELARRPELMDNDPEVHELMVTATAWWIDQAWLKPDDVMDLITIDIDKIQKRFKEIAARVGDDMWNKYRADLGNLRVPEMPKETK